MSRPGEHLRSDVEWERIPWIGVGSELMISPGILIDQLIGLVFIFPIFLLLPENKRDGKI